MMLLPLDYGGQISTAPWYIEHIYIVYIADPGLQSGTDTTQKDGLPY